MKVAPPLEVRVFIDDDGDDDDLTELEITSAELEQDTIWVYVRVGQIAALRSALKRTEDRFRAAVNGQPVRDMTETLAENRAALEGA